MNDVATIKKDVDAVVFKSNMLEVTDQISYDEANQFLSTIKAGAKAVKSFFKPMKEKTQAAHKQIVSQENDLLKPLAEAEQVAKSKTVAYWQEQEKKRQELERQQREKAEKEAREERERLESEAKEADKKGEGEKAQELKQQAEATEPVDMIVAPQVQKSTGVSYREIWKYKVEDFKALPDVYKVANSQMLSRIAIATKGKPPIPGVKFYSETSQANRG